MGNAYDNDQRRMLFRIPPRVINKAQYFIKLAREFPTPTGWDSDSQFLGELERWISSYVSHLLLNVRTSTETVHTYVYTLLNYWTKKGLRFDRKYLLGAKNARISYHRRLSATHALSLLPSQLPRDLPGKPPIMWFDLDHIFTNMELYGYDKAYMCAITSLSYCTALRASSAVTLTFTSIQRILIDRNNPDILYMTFVLQFVKGNNYRLLTFSASFSASPPNPPFTSLSFLPSLLTLLRLSENTNRNRYGAIIEKR